MGLAHFNIYFLYYFSCLSGIQAGRVTERKTAIRKYCINLYIVFPTDQVKYKTFPNRMGTVCVTLTTSYKLQTEGVSKHKIREQKEIRTLQAHHLVTQQ